ncbi:uncharacterized protein YKR070W isoform X1 [Vitis vinifera]|uniref:uncharacterized protein YKR070W isoform X1 n=1 Tax=Vitis vinifera TaxID=29760 RepID=UPI0005402E8F|nr:uncharacterized protein YKR070W isoform X1 [Vitis vinifera]|eukprot:XP_010658468.1 PREDICTED: uncharacterized protein YKR070W isoform X5 [Vitis vinifera]
MKFGPFGTVLRWKNRAPLPSLRLLSQLHSRSSFGIAFDIDGVILRGRVPIGGSPQALRRLYRDYGALKFPFLFLTNGGGIPESRRASELSELLGVNILPSQVVQGHSPFKNLLKSSMDISFFRFENELIIALGKGEPALVMSEYGFKKVLSLDEYASYFKNIDPVSQYKNWTTEKIFNSKANTKDLVPRYDLLSDRVKAAFVVSDPVDWGRDIQVLCDVLRSGGLPGQENGPQPPLYFAADDLEYQAAFPSERLGMGAFRIALESIFNRIHHNALEYTSFGKPNPFVFKNAEAILRQLQPSCHDGYFMDNGNTDSNSFETLYMIGDNPLVDIRGTQKAGHPWFSILTRTGVFKGKENHAEFPADLVVDTVEEAVDYILKKE